MFDFSSSPLLARRTPGERRLRLFADLLIHWAIAFFVPLIVSFIPGTVATVVFGLNALSGIFSDALSAGTSGGAATFDSEAIRVLTEQISGSEGYRIAELFGEAWAIALALFVCLVIQRRSLATVGIEKKGAARHCALGFLFGAILCSATVFVSCLSRAATFDGYSGNAQIFFLVLVLFGYLIQSAAEEILIHGLLMTSLARHFRWLPSVLISALFFALMHTVNSGVTLLSLLNVFLFGVFLGLFVIRTGSVLGAVALHAAWNFAEGQIFGCSVSGFSSFSSLFTVTADTGRTATNGGAFGPEGGLAATMILLLALIAVLIFPSFKKKSEPTA